MTTPPAKEQAREFRCPEQARTSILVFAPTFNERSAVALLLDAILALPLAADVLIVDDSSNDGTTEYLLQRRGVEPRLEVLVRPGKLGIGSAHKLGWSYARQNGYGYIVTLDADLSHDPADIPRLIAALETTDVAVGSRFAAGGTLDYTGWRRLVSILGNRFAAALLRLPLSEYTTSFRAARLSAIPEGIVESIPADHYAFFVSCVVAFARAKLRMKEVPIRFYNRHGGTSKLPRSAIIGGALNVLRLAINRNAVGHVSSRSPSPSAIAGSGSARSPSSRSSEVGASIDERSSL